MTIEKLELQSNADLKALSETDDEQTVDNLGDLKDFSQDEYHHLHGAYKVVYNAINADRANLRNVYSAISSIRSTKQTNEYHYAANPNGYSNSVAASFVSKLSDTLAGKMALKNSDFLKQNTTKLETNLQSLVLDRKDYTNRLSYLMAIALRLTAKAPNFSATKGMLAGFKNTVFGSEKDFDGEAKTVSLESISSVYRLGVSKAVEVDDAASDGSTKSKFVPSSELAKGAQLSELIKDVSNIGEKSVSWLEATRAWCDFSNKEVSASPQGGNPPGQ